MDVPPWTSTPGWTPPREDPFATPGKGARFAGVAFFLLLLVAVAVAGTYLFQEDESESFDEDEINRLIAQKRSELSSRAAMRGTVGSESDEYASQLYIDSSPPGAVVILDLDTIGVTPLNGRAVEGGVYVLSIRKEDYAPIDTVVFILAEDPSPQLFVDLAPLERDSQSASQDRIASRETPAAFTSPRSPADTRRAESSARQTANRVLQDRSAQDRVLQDRSAQERGRLEEQDPPSSQPEARSSLGVRVTAEGRNDNRRAAQRGTAEAATENTPESASGLLTVLVKPWGSIYVDGDLLKVNTDVQHTTSLPLGRHIIRAEHPALGSHERVVEVRPNQPQTVVFDLLESTPGDERPN